jgi:hypothetical protein
LPSAALGKAFAECLAGFAECPQHSTKRASAAVRRPTNLHVGIACTGNARTHCNLHTNIHFIQCCIGFHSL